MADAAHAIFTRDARRLTGQFFIDDSFLYERDLRDFSRYSVDPPSRLCPISSCQRTACRRPASLWVERRSTSKPLVLSADHIAETDGQGVADQAYKIGDLAQI